MKAHVDGKKAVVGKQEMRQYLLRALRRLQPAPHRIRALFRYPETASAMVAQICLLPEQ